MGCEKTDIRFKIGDGPHKPFLLSKGADAVS
jgi:hypothetical protein